MDEIYLDNSATTKPYYPVIRYMAKAMRSNYGNPSSAHGLGLQAEKLVKDAKKKIAGTLLCSPNELFFTSGGTESNNLAIMGILGASRARHVVSTVVEHPATLNTLRHMEDLGYSVTTVSVDSRGVVNLDEVEDAITKDTALVSVMHVNNEIGTLEPIAKIGEIIKAKSVGTYFHVDAVQSYCKVPFSVDSLGCDLLTLSSHKIHGPKGVGALYVRRGTRISPVVFGGGQQRDLRPGTEDTFGIAGFGMAADISHKNMPLSMKTARRLKERLERLIVKHVLNVHVNTPGTPSAPHILNVSFPGIPAQVLLGHLDREGIYVSAGSACSAHKNKPSYVLTAIGLAPELIDSSIRFSLSELTTDDDIDKTVLALKRLVPKLRETASK
jgi:cysteine desulfurase